MKKNLRYLIASLLVLMMLLSLCACAQTGTAGNSGELDLDYVGEDTDQPEEEKPWYSWFTEAFSFGKKETTTTPSQSKPDSVADFYAQGSGDAPQGNKSNKTDQTPSATPEEDTANKPSNSGGKKDDNKKDDNKKDDSKKEDGTNANSSSTNGKADKKDTASKAAKTGDASTALPYMLLMLASGSAVVILKKKKEQ